jgi:hypothetical protein
MLLGDYPRLIAYVSGLEADAKRYRWLRDRLDDDDEWLYFDANIRCPYRSPNNYEKDQCIDTAISQDTDKGKTE